MDTDTQKAIVAAMPKLIPQEIKDRLLELISKQEAREKQKK